MSTPDSTFGGGFRPGLVTITDPVQTWVDFLASEQHLNKTSGVTLDSTKVAANGAGDKIVKGGTPLQKDGATGKYYPAIADAANAANATLLLFAGDINLRYGDQIVGGMIGGAVRTARIPGSGTPAILTALKAALPHIIWE
jgi:hypothetical protein